MMFPEEPNEPEPPDKRISWSICVLALGFFGLVGGLLAPSMLIPWLSWGALFGAAAGLGLATAFLVNFVRPRYEKSHGLCRAFYDFLLKQMGPLD